MENLFFAAGLDGSIRPQVRTRLESAAHLLDPNFNSVADDCLHLSIQSLGQYDRIPDRLIGQAVRMGSRVEVPAFTATFDRLQGFNGTYGYSVVFTAERPADGFLTLRKAIWAEMQLAGMELPQNRSFSPHVSLAYQETRIQTLLVEPVTWTVHELVLIKSLHGRSKHICLGRWPLWVPAASPLPPVAFDGPGASESPLDQR